MLYYIMFAITFFFVIIYWLSVLFLRLKIADFLKPIVMFLNGANIAVTAIAIIYTLSLNSITKEKSIEIISMKNTNDGYICTLEDEQGDIVYSNVQYNLSTVKEINTKTPKLKIKYKCVSKEDKNSLCYKLLYLVKQDVEDNDTNNNSYTFILPKGYIKENNIDVR